MLCQLTLPHAVALKTLVCVQGHAGVERGWVFVGHDGSLCRWKVYPGFPRGLPWVPVFSPVYVRFPYIKRSLLGSRVFSGFHSFYCDPQWSTLGSHRNKSSAWVPSPIPVDGGSWRTGAQENTAVRAHGRRFIKKGMCRMRRGYASGVLAQVLQMQGPGARTHHV